MDVMDSTEMAAALSVLRKVAIISPHLGKRVMINATHGKGSDTVWLDEDVVTVVALNDKGVVLVDREQVVHHVRYEDIHRVAAEVLS